MTEPRHSAGPVQDPAEETAGYAVPDNPHHDDTDVDAALERKTDDGKGGAVVPGEDFVSYTAPECDKPDEQEDNS